MKKVTKIALAVTGMASLAIAIYYISTHTSVHEVGEAEDNNLNDQEELWHKVSEYCDNDVVATEVAWNNISEDFFEEGDNGMAFLEAEKPKYDIPPYEIGQEAFISQEPKFEKRVLWWDTELNEFSDEQDDILYDKNTFLGESNIKRFLEDEEITFMYIRNENNEIDFELVK